MINIKREQFYDFIKTNKEKEGTISKATQHYLDYFDKYQSTGKKSSWNWAAFFFTFQWMLYRKMYLFSFSFLILFVISTLSLIYLLTSNTLWIISCLFILASYLFFGFFGNYIYYIHLKKKIKKLSLNCRLENVDKITACISFFVVPFSLINGVITSMTDLVKTKQIQRLTKVLSIICFSLLLTLLLILVQNDSKLLKEMFDRGKSYSRRSLRAIGVNADLAQDAIDIVEAASIANLMKTAVTKL